MSSDECEINPNPPKHPGKTPISAIKELCDKEGGLLMFDHCTTQPNPKIFSCTANAFNVEAVGGGRSKKEAEHDACANLISE